MKKICIAFFPMFILCSMNVLRAQSVNESEKFSWLIGTWMDKKGEEWFEETWTKKDETTFTGKGFYIVKTDTVFREELLIQKIGQHWVYIASVGNSAPALFTLISSENDTLLFENKEHDFPQRIGYTKKSGGKSAVAWIEGKAEGKEMKEEYQLEKTK